METLAKQKITKAKSLYQLIAEKFNTDEGYVGKINRAERIPQRGKGLKIYNELKKYNNQ